MEKTELFKRYRDTGDVELRNQLVEEHLYMVDVLIKKYLGKGVGYDDLYQVGALALISAVERFDPDKGFAFSSFATPTILGEIKKYFRDKEWAIKVPRRLKSLAGQIPGIRDELAQELGRSPTVSEMAERLEVSDAMILEAMESSQAYAPMSLDQTFEESGEDGEGSILERYTGREEQGYGNIEYAEIVRSVLASLKEQDKHIFRMRFIENKTQAEVGNTLGISQMTVSRVEKGIKDKFLHEIHRN
ncbi:MAG TPA: SigB/SigF/SigG family RNA polymerase sigma factor [Bacillota bacterium]|nr:SigB/SigF/SigG family RNA polymerase sigma factor [Bacillota bacterium]